MKALLVSVAVCGIWFAVSVSASELAGRASVIDGDTIEIHGHRVRLAGIDAPESRQLCAFSDGRSWRCGQRAAFALADLIGSRTVSCRIEGQDRYGRSLALCVVGRADLGEWLVSNGWAVPYYDRPGNYRAARDRAAAARLGIWQGDFEMPKDWRRRHRNR